MLRSRVLATAVTASALLIPAAAQADWRAETPVRAELGRPGVALAGTGDLAIRWTESHGNGNARGGWVRPTEHLAARAPGAGFRVSVRDAAFDVFGRADGTLTAFGNSGGRAVLATRAPGGTFGASGAVAPAAATGRAFSTGGAAAITYDAGATTKVIVRAAGGAFGAPADLRSGSGAEVHLGVADDGQAIAAWQDYSGSQGDEIVYRLRAADGTWGPLQNIGVASAPAVAMGPDGDAILLARRASAGRYEALVRRSGQPFGAALAVAPTASGYNPAKVAVGPDGVAVAVLNQHFDDGRWSLLARRFDGTAFGAPQELITGNAFEGIADLAVDDAGEAWLATVKPSGAAAQVLVRRAAGATFGAAEPLRAAAQDGVTSTDVDLAADGHGRAAVVWTSEAGGTGELNLATTGLPASPATMEPDVVADPPAGDQQGRPAPGATPVPGTAPAPAPSPVASRRAVAPAATKLSGVAVTVKRGRATVAFRASAAAKVTVLVERRSGKRWTRVKRVTVSAQAGANRAALGTVRRGRYRVTATAGAATAKATFGVRR